MPCSLLDSSSLSLLPVAFIDELNDNGGGRVQFPLPSSSASLSRLAASRFGLAPIARDNILQDHGRGMETDENDQDNVVLPITAEERSTRHHDGARQNLLQILQSILDMMDDDIQSFQQTSNCPNRVGVLVASAAPENDRHIDFGGRNSMGNSTDSDNDTNTNAASK